MKKLLVIHNGYPLHGDGGDKVRTLNMINSLKSMGFDVSFLAFFKKDFLSLKVEKRKLPRGVKSYFIYTFPDRLGLGGLAALFRAWITYILVKSKKIEIIHLETSLSASCVKFLNKDVPVVVDFHADPVPELKMNRESHAVINRAKKDVCYALSRSQCLIAVSDNLADNLKSYYNYEALVSILPCSFNNENFQVDLKESSDLRKKLSLEGRIVLCYLGGLHKWQCIEETLDIFIRLQKKDPRYFLCLYTNGDMGVYADKLKLIGSDCLSKSLSHEEVPLYLSIIDAGFVLRHNSLVNINASPTKIAEYMAVGAMVIATKYSGDAQVLIEKSGYGVVLDDLERVSDEIIDDMNAKIYAYVDNKLEASLIVKDCVVKNRLWQMNEDKLRLLYSEL